MGEKDLSQRRLFEFNDVFAEVVNGLIFSGRKVVNEDELEDIPAKTNVRTNDGKLTYQERDVSKLWKKKNVIISLFGVENQTKIDNNMIFRIIGYDGVSYKNQLNKTNKVYPVVTIVLYYGKKKWKSPLSLRKSLNIPKELKGLVSDYRANVYNLGCMPDEEIARLRGDFKIVVDFLKNGDSIKEKREKITHVAEMLDFFGAFLKDERFDKLSREVLKSDIENGGRDMCDIKEMLDRIENRGIEQGIEQGESGIIIKMYTKGMTLEEIAKVIDRDREEVRKIIESKIAVIS